MSVRSGRSGSRSQGSSQYKEIRLPDTAAVNALIYFCGRNPKKAKSVRRYYNEDDFDTRSTNSGGSVFSWASTGSQVYLVESTSPYWDYGYADSVSYSASSSSSSSKKRRSSTKSSRGPSRTSQPVPIQVPTGTWARHATVQDAEDDDDDSDDSDDSSSDSSFDDYHGGGGGGGGGGFQPPHPGMMPPHYQGPPPGAFQPVYGMYPGQQQQQQQQHYHATPRPTPPAGYYPPPPMQQAAGPPPPPPGGHFVPGVGGIQVFVDG